MPELALDALLPWYRLHRRDLPWRVGRDAYSIWVSEIMLQQTGVTTVIPYFERWLVRFPTVNDLAQASEQDVLSMWQGLGYYRRCRNLLAGAKVIVVTGWPTSAKEWKEIPGVGRYTAGAVASIALGEPAPLVDGNVERVYARLTGDVASGAELNRKTWIWAEREIRSADPGDWNQALMELGATVCTPTAPRCDVCPLAKVCCARKSGLTAKLPTQTPQKAVVQLEFRVEICHCNDRFGVRQIPEGEWWAGMWEFPRYLPEAAVPFKANEQPLPRLKHVVTHHRITLYPALSMVLEPNDRLMWFSADELATMPMPAPQRKLLNQAIAALRLTQAQAT